jgi:uncharacterized protein (TIGR02145 family)
MKTYNMKNLFSFIIAVVFIYSSAISQCTGPECCSFGTVWDVATSSCLVSVTGDADNDGCIGTFDLLSFLGNFGACQSFYGLYDCNEDGVVDGLDEGCVDEFGNGGGDCECDEHFDCAYLNTETAVGACNGCDCYTFEHGGLGGIIEDCDENGTIDDIDLVCVEMAIPFNCGVDHAEYQNHLYTTVQIGDQCWFSENCRYLPSVFEPTNTSDIDPRFYVQGYTGTDESAAKNTSNYNIYGGLYNWVTINTINLCPIGWHLPTEYEYTILSDHLGGALVAGDEMKDDAFWDGSNSYGFTANPGGNLYGAGFFGTQHIGNHGFYWSSTPLSSSQAIYYRLTAGDDEIHTQYNHYDDAYSARCLMGPVTPDPIYGCTMLGYCNYNSLATVDDESCEHWEDLCGMPCGNGIPAGDCDCNGNVLDDCGVCGGDNSSCFTECGNDMEYAGYNYATIQIGPQCWYAENNRYLPALSSPSDQSYTDPKYYEYYSEDALNYYGVSYNYAAVISSDICPSGWHMPIDDEFQQLEMTLGMSSSDASSSGGRGTQGVELKSIDGWGSGGGGNNGSGFNAKPGGAVYAGAFVQHGQFGHFWSLTESSTNNSWGRSLTGLNDMVYRIPDFEHSNAFSSRCLLGDEPITGCINPARCNYNPLATIGCGMCCEYADECGVCGGSGASGPCGCDPVPAGTSCDCMGNPLDGYCDCWSNVIDECGVCGGSGIPTGDCDCFGNTFDDCGICGGDNSTCFTGCGDGLMYQGYDYETVQIGDQCWFAENLRYLPYVDDPSDHGPLDNACYRYNGVIFGGYEYDPVYDLGRAYAYGYYGNNVSQAILPEVEIFGQIIPTYYSAYGALYDRYILQYYNSISASVCPSGWHVPTDIEFEELIEEVGGGNLVDAAYRLKGDQWLSPDGSGNWNGGGSNSSGFNALPSGGLFMEFGTCSGYTTAWYPFTPCEQTVGALTIDFKGAGNYGTWLTSTVEELDYGSGYWCGDDFVKVMHLSSDTQDGVLLGISNFVAWDGYLTGVIEKEEAASIRCIKD